jgi:2'-5' RNA ligase
MARIVAKTEEKIPMPPSSDSSPFVRAFVAIEIGEDVRRRLAEAQDRLRRASAHVAWVPPQNIHVSLAFLGDIPRETIVPKVAAALDKAAGPVSPFGFDVAELGTFGSRRSPRVIWAGVHGEEPLKALHGRVYAALAVLGLRLDEREFAPHLTLGRVRSPRGVEDLMKAIAALGQPAFGRVETTRVLLMRSTLLPSGAEYAVLHESPLVVRPGMEGDTTMRSARDAAETPEGDAS